MNKLDNVTVELVEKYLNEFQNSDRYRIGDIAVSKLFESYPKNTCLEDVLLKVSILNDMYSTNIFATFEMAKHIVSLNIDEKLEQGSPEVVHEIAEGHGNVVKKSEKERNFYSFATKYCSWSKPDKYCIYDGFVDKVLWAYQKQDNFTGDLKFKRIYLKSSREFMKVIVCFKEFYNLNQFSLKELDKFLWMYGKEKFSKSYKPNKA